MAPAVRTPRGEAQNYRRGGFYPVHLGDIFKSGRYTVIHKLGHGGFATVWLARDCVRSRYVALKILAARLSKDCPEVEILRRLRNSDEHQGKAYVMSLLDHFYIEGSNGKHLCVVSEVAGPSIKQFNECPGFKSGSRRLRGRVARKVALQATEGLAFIHGAGVVHGDFTAANLLLQLANIDEWTIDQIHERLGVPQRHDLHGIKGRTDDVSAPRYTVDSISMNLVDPQWFSDEIMIIDFGIAFLQDVSSPDIGTPRSYCAPEFYFGSPRSTLSDIWALGCTIFEIRTGSCLFRYRGVPSRDEMLMAMVEVLGKLPVAWLNEWERGEEWYNTETKEGGDLSMIIEGSLYDNIMEIGLHDGDVAIRPKNKTNTIFHRDPTSSSSSSSSDIKTPSDHTTYRLIEMVEELTTSEAAEVLAQVNKSNSGSSQEKESSASCTGSGSAGQGPESKKTDSGGSGSGSGSSNPKSGMSSEGIETGRAPNTMMKTTEATISEENLGPEMGESTVADFLETTGTLISDVEGVKLETLLREALIFEPEDRFSPSRMAKNSWFTDKYAKTEAEIEAEDVAAKPAGPGDVDQSAE